MKIPTLFCLLACLGLVSSQASYYCGRRLATALDLLCDGQLIKRSEPQASRIALGWPWIDASRAHGLAYRRKRGAADECCNKPCTVDELMAYCH